MDEDKYTAALAVFGELEGYRDTEIKKQQCNYSIADAYYSQGDIQKSADIFLSLGDYYNSADRASQAYLGIASGLAKNGD